jgi:hypothetical protein
VFRHEVHFNSQTKSAPVTWKNKKKSQHELMVLSHQKLRWKAKNFKSLPKYSVVSLQLVSNIK